MIYANYILVFLEGVLTFISPCILPLLPLYFFYLAGVSTAGGKTGGTRLFVNSLAFVVGFTVIFVVLGATATSLGHFLKNHMEFFRIASGMVMIVFGLNFIGVFRLKFLNLEKRLNYEFKELRFFNSVIFGMVFAFGWTPCLGAFLGSALLLAGSSDTVLKGILLLLIYSVGLGVPFMITSILFEKVKDAVKRLQSYSGIINAVSGIVLILAGILVMTDSLKYVGKGWF